MTEVRLFSLPAEVGRESEDACAIGDGIGVVVDGAGLPKSMRQGCSHSVAWYARMLAEEFRMRLENRDVSMTDALAAAIDAVTATHADSCDLAGGSPSGTVAAWRVNGDEVEHLVLCDASIVLIGHDGVVTEITDKSIDAVVQEGAEARATAAGIPCVTAEVRFAALDAARNVDGGFWCAQTDPEGVRHALFGSTPMRDLRAVVASSDGARAGTSSWARIRSNASVSSSNPVIWPASRERFVLRRTPTGFRRSPSLTTTSPCSLPDSEPADRGPRVAARRRGARETVG